MVKITHLLNKFGDIKAYMAWDIVTDKGVIDPDGKYLYVYELYICKKYRYNIFKILGKLLGRIKPYCSDCKYIYWGRRKYKNRLKCFNINRFWKFI